jgi:hypothetical protein
MSEKAPAPSEAKPAPIVDPSPHAPPIMLGNTEYVFPKAAASDKETLALKPNSYEDATEGPQEPVDPNSYVAMTKPDGSEFLSPLSNVEHYEAKGYKAGKAEDIPDLVAYHAERASKAP